MMEPFGLSNEMELLACVSRTVSMSILLHGLTGTPLAIRIRRKSG